MEIVGFVAALLILLAVVAGVVVALVAIARSLSRGHPDDDPFRGRHWHMRPAVSGDDALSQLLAALGVGLGAIALDLLARQLGWTFFGGRTAVFTAAVVGIALAYRLRGPIVLAFGVLASYLWVGLWLARWAPDAGQAVMVVAGLGLLSVCAWALGRIHWLSERTRRFGFVYWFLGLVGLLTVLLWISSQWGIAALGVSRMLGAVLSSWRMDLGLGALTVAALGSLVWWLVEERRAWPEVAALAVLAVAFAVFALVPPPISGGGSWSPFSGESLKLASGAMAWAVTWNVLLLGSLLGLVALGYAHREDWLVNLGAVLLFLFVLVKYFDWLFTFLDRSLAFIVTGLLLVGVGLLMERGRRMVIKAMEAEDDAA